MIFVKLSIMNKYILTIILSITITLVFSQELDTVYSYSNIESESPFMYYPSRAHGIESNNSNQREYIDSIRVKLGDNTVLNKYHKKYYLKSYGKDSVLRVEGEFFDCYPNKNIIEYDVNGDTLAYGNYKIVKRRKPKTILKGRSFGRKTVVEWKSYYYCFKDGEWYNYDEKRELMLQTFYDISNKRIKKTAYRTNLGKLEKVEIVEKIKAKNYILQEP